MTNPEPMADIEEQRAELIDTVDALRRRVDIQSRSKTVLRTGLIAVVLATVAFVGVGRFRARSSD